MSNPRVSKPLYQDKNSCPSKEHEAHCTLWDVHSDCSGLFLALSVLAKDDNATLHSHSILHLINHGYIHLYPLVVSIGITVA